MWVLWVAALLVAAWGLAPAVLAVGLEAPPTGVSWIPLIVRMLVATSVAAALLYGGRVVRWSVMAASAVLTVMGLSLLYGGPVIAPLVWGDSPRLTIAFTGLTTTLAALVGILLLGLAARGHGAAQSAVPAWTIAGALGGALVLATALGTSQMLARYPVLVSDDADLLTPEQERRIARFHRLLRHDHDIDYRLITGRNLGDIDRYAARRFADEAVGRASDGGHGLLLVIDAGSDLLRIEVSRSLEPVYVDAFVAYVEQRQMTEFFADGRVADGVLATTELLVTRAQRAAQGLAVPDSLRLEGSAGGGARTAARLEDDTGEAPTSEQATTHPDEPRAVLEAYRHAMARRNDNPELELYSRATRAMLQDWTVTPAQMDSVAEDIERCPIEDVRYGDGHAVLRAPIGERECPPYFFVREDERWRLDLEPMGRAIRFGRNNAWRLDPGQLPSQYHFGFRDWQFDSNGYPVARR